MTKKKSQRKAGNTVKEPSSLEIEKAGKQLIQYLLAGAWLGHGIHLITRGNTCVMILRRDDGNEQTERQSGRIPYAGLPGSEIVFVGMQEVPDKAQKEWLRERLRTHFAATVESVLILMPPALFEVVIADYLRKDWRQLAQQYWKEVQNGHGTLCQTCQQEVRDLNSLTGFVSEKTRSREHIDAYTAALKSFAITSVLRTGMSPLGVCALVRKGQTMIAENPFACTGDDVRDGWCDGRFACRYLDLPRNALDEALERFPKTFKFLGFPSSR